MKYSLPVIGWLMFCIAGLSVTAQTLDFGLGISKFMATDLAGSQVYGEANYHFYGAGNLPIVRFKNESSVSLEGGAAFSLSGALVLGSIPCHVLINYGSDATKESFRKVGVAAGAGVNAVFANILDRSFNYLTPSLIGELHYLTEGRSLFKLKIIPNIGPKPKKSFPNDPNASFNGTMTVNYTWAIYLSYTPNY